MKKIYKKKEELRKDLAEFIGKGRVECVAKFTNGTKANNLRLLIDVKVSLKDKVVNLDHLWIEDNNIFKVKKCIGNYSKFSAKVDYYDFYKTKTGLKEIKLKEKK